MNLRKTQTYNHICDLMKLRIFIEVVNYLVNKTMPTMTQKIEKMQILNQVSFGKHWVQVIIFQNFRNEQKKIC